MTESPHLKTDELARRWSISPATLERWRCEGIGPVFLKLGGIVVYRQDDIETYEAECLFKSTAEKCVGGAV